MGHTLSKKRTFAKQLSRARSFCIEVRDLGVAAVASDEQNRDAYQQAQSQLAALVKKHKLKSNISAVDAVSTAVAAAVAFIESTLRCMHSSSSSNAAKGGLRGLLVFVISLGGDTDTVAAMAAAAVYCTYFGYEGCVGGEQEGEGGEEGEPFRMAHLCRLIQCYDEVNALAPALANLYRLNC